ncbi:class I SAM-dependent methyltransferase [Pseudokineococcus sp. 1T1Z-3]|uniref:class I SAM-dependent methyltransferase n=1 Tax=Pseudokineococcus sp. 1T1Z-3 TaxID=3132745 RepID=UPI0030ACA1FF
MAAQPATDAVSTSGETAADEATPWSGRRAGGGTPSVLLDGVVALAASAAGPARLGSGGAGAGGARAGGEARPVRVLDLGGGTGGLAVELASRGHDVVVVDPSPDALASLARRADEMGVGERLTGVQGDSEDLSAHVPDASVDVLLAHGVLEVVDDPRAALAACRRALRPTGRLSVLVAGRGAAVLSRVASGHLRHARALQVDPAGRWGPDDPLLRRFDVDGARALLGAAGFSVLRTHGVGVLRAVAPRSAADPAAADVLEQMERSASTDPTLLGVAAAIHLHAAPV